MAKSQFESFWMQAVKSLPCGCCGASAPSDAHHIREGQGMSQRAGNCLVVPLCKSCHQGPQGVHGDKTFLRIFKLDELKILNNTIPLAISQMRDTHAI